MISNRKMDTPLASVISLKKEEVDKINPNVEFRSRLIKHEAFPAWHSLIVRKES